MANVKKKKVDDAPVIETLNPKTLGQEKVKDLFSDFQEEDDMGQRVCSVAGTTYRMRQKNPYSHWEFVPEQGMLPPELKGVFTTFRAAEDALSKYVARKSKEGSIAREYHKELVEKGF
jgi:hypothetical protein